MGGEGKGDGLRPFAGSTERKEEINLNWGGEPSVGTWPEMEGKITFPWRYLSFSS
jgi:hypothetical protein